MYEASSETRKAIAAASSTGSATRPIGASLPSMRSASSRVRPAGSTESVIGVATVPGSTVLQRMPWWA